MEGKDIVQVFIQSGGILIAVLLVRVLANEIRQLSTDIRALAEKVVDHNAPYNGIERRKS